VVNGEMSLRRLKLSIYEVVTPREEEEVAKRLIHSARVERDFCTYIRTKVFASLQQQLHYNNF
jgi:hypothetical protein